MKLGKRWLCVLWVTLTVVWSQGRDVSGCGIAASHAELARITVSPQPCAVTLQDTDEKHAWGKNTQAGLLFIAPAALPIPLPVLASQALSHSLPVGISAGTWTRQLARGPPLKA